MEVHQMKIESNPIAFNVTFKSEPNTDKDYVKQLKKRQKRNNGHCPSRMEKSPDTKCPCKRYRETEECLCGMYIKVPIYEEDEE